VFRDENVALFWWGILVGMSSVGSVILVERTPWCWPRMCPFCITSDSGKYFATFFALMSGQERSFVNSLEPGGFCWETRCAMEVPNSGFNAGEFVYIVEVLLAVILAHLECYMVMGYGLFRWCTWS